MATREYTPREFAAKEQVTIPTVRHWIRIGAVAARRTVGGHYRILEAVTDGNATRAATSNGTARDRK